MGGLSDIRGKGMCGMGDMGGTCSKGMDDQGDTGGKTMGSIGDLGGTTSKGMDGQGYNGSQRAPFLEPVPEDHIIREPSPEES